MLSLDPNKRMNAEEVLNDTWLKQRANNEIPDTPIAVKALRNLSNFRAGLKLQQAALSYITTQMSTSQEISKLRDLFIRLDLNGDGVLSRDELLAGYKLLGLDTPSDIEDIIERCDADGSGFIDYTEFLTATINWRGALSKERLEDAFRAFDTDNSGKITVQELKDFIGGNDVQEETWISMLEEADTNGDGEIDFDEFVEVMSKYLFNSLSSKV